MDLRHFGAAPFTIICCSLLVLFTSVSSSPVVSTAYTCQQVDRLNSPCSRWFQHAQLPNVFGHGTLQMAVDEMNTVVSKVPNPTDEVLAFMCAMFLPPCSVLSPGHDRTMPLPCRSSCETALATVSKRRISGGVDSRTWPVMCHTLPTQRCYIFGGQSGITYVKNSLSGGGGTQKTSKPDEIMKFASIEAELGDNNEGYEVEVVSLSANQGNGRRYDIIDLGDPDLFQGWVDVQGKGAANDYCRVVGKSKRRFLSCNLAGSQSQGHHYVSKLGFELGYPGTWFMRDMDGDGRDDYCRCVGQPTKSKVTCMKAGEKGFYGSPMQNGSQHSFVLSSSSGCHNRRVNTLFGE